MKLIIAGSRTFEPSLTFITQCIKLHKIVNITQVVSGHANGVDSAGEHFASHYAGDLRTFLPNWDEHGKAAGPIRNREMANYADALLLIWDGESKGSASMKREMLHLNKPVYEVILKSYNVS